MCEELVQSFWFSLICIANNTIYFSCKLDYLGCFKLKSEHDIQNTQEHFNCSGGKKEQGLRVRVKQKQLVDHNLLFWIIWLTVGMAAYAWLKQKPRLQFEYWLRRRDLGSPVFDTLPYSTQSSEAMWQQVHESTAWSDSKWYSLIGGALN